MCTSKPKKPKDPAPPPPAPPPPSQTNMGFSSAARNQGSRQIEGLRTQRRGYQSLRVGLNRKARNRLKPKKKK